MRTAFFETLMELASTDERIFLIVGDLGFGVVEPFEKQYPDRFLNPGIAEQNMTGIATGLALSGKIVFTYSIANFPTIRCLEQIRNDVCYHNANVKIVAVGGGFAYGSLGMTHFATEDLAILRSLPQMTVVAPGDPIEAKLATKAITEIDGPCYLRLGRAGEINVHSKDIMFTIGKAITAREGNDITMISTGAMLQNAMKAADKLSVKGINARVLSMHTIKPIDKNAILDAAQQTRAVFTLEEHNIDGGLGGATAEVLAESGIATVFRRFGISSDSPYKIGDQDFLREAHGLSVETMESKMLSILKTVLD